MQGRQAHTDQPWQPEPSSVTAAGGLSKYDLNKDGRLSADEIEALDRDAEASKKRRAHPPHLQPHQHSHPSLPPLTPSRFQTRATGRATHLQLHGPPHPSRPALTPG